MDMKVIKLKNKIFESLLILYVHILVYLDNWLKKLKSDDKPQRTLLLTLMTELKLYKQNKLENSSEYKANDELSKFARDALVLIIINKFSFIYIF